MPIMMVIATAAAVLWHAVVLSLKYLASHKILVQLEQQKETPILHSGP